MNKTVGIFKRVKLANGKKQLAPVAYAGNGRIKPDVVMVEGKEERHPEGSYYLGWFDGALKSGKGAKRVWLSVGKDAAQASAKAHLQEGVLLAKAAGVANVQKVDGAQPKADGPLLVHAVALYLQDIKLSKKPKTHSAYKVALEYFTESCQRQRVADIDRTDMLKFAAFLRDEKKLSPRSVYNKFEATMSFLKANKVRDIVGKNDWPRYTEEEPEVYTKEELAVFFKACDDDECLWFRFFLMTGLREQEAMYLYWRDIDFANSTVRVSHKPDRGWTPKAYKEREVPIPTELLKMLKEHSEYRDSGCELVFPTGGCNPKLDFLDCCKAVAKRAELTEADFWLHKFRATFATWHLWAGVDLRTVQHWMGHSDMESTMRYLKPNRSLEVRAKVNATFA